MDARIVRRYASALFASAQAENVVDLVESDLGLITYSFESIPSLEEAVVSPLIPAAKKREVITSIFKEKIHETTLFYLYLLIDNRREEVIKSTEAEYIRLANEARGIIAAQVTSAVELTKDETIRLKEKLSAYTGKHVDIKADVDPSIIGGLVVRIGDTVMDGSIAGHLERLKEEFLGR
ncbi:MAG: F0F1 ATP synthase subunit delta [Armatimonadota bacterium]